jgi:hypothetical protein
MRGLGRRLVHREADHGEQKGISAAAPAVEARAVLQEVQLRRGAVG